MQMLEKFIASSFKPFLQALEDIYFANVTILAALAQSFMLEQEVFLRLVPIKLLLRDPRAEHLLE
jgi:hypothetical protein